MLATVITCPQRWDEYQRFRRQFEALGFPFPLRTFQTAECLGNAYANNNLNARAALLYARACLPDDGESWILYLEDDVILSPELPAVVPTLVEKGNREAVDCWYLCNRRNPVVRQYREGILTINELAFPPLGAHGLLLPRRHLDRILAAHWGDVSDQAIFGAIRHPGLRILQIVQPVLVEHIGVISTYHPNVEQKLEVNHAS